MLAPHKRRAAPRRIVAIALLGALWASTACSAKALDRGPAGVAPAQAASSPPLTVAPAGTVRPLSGQVRGALFDARTGQLVVLQSDPARLELLGSGDTPQREVALPSPATALAGDGAGTVFLSTNGGYVAVDLTDSRVTTVRVAGAEQAPFSSITRRTDGTVVLATSDGSLSALRPGSTDAERTDVHAHVDSLAAQGNTVAVLDRSQTSVTTVGADGRVGQSLRAGQGATTMSADSQGRLLVADTRGGQLLVFGVDPLILRQAYPVADAPFGVVGSTRLAWVSQTSANTVVGYDLSTGIPQEKVRYPSVRQPNALAFDEAAGALFVVSGDGGGVQVIEHAAGAR